MKRSVLTYKTRLLLTTGALFITCASMICMSSPVAHAQDNENSQLLNRLNEIENQVQTLNRAVYRGDQKSVAAVGKGVSDADTQAAANADQRMSAIEEQQQKITGTLEKLSHDVQLIQDRLDKSQADTEQRLQALEHGSAAAAAAATAAPVMANAPAATAGGDAGASAETLGTADGGSAGPAEALYEDAFADVKAAKYDEGEATFKQFLSQYPGHPLTANAEYWLGEIYYVQGKFKEAARTFAQGYQSFPKSGKAEDSLYKLALSLNKLGKKDDACLSLRQLQKDFGGDTGPLHLKAQAEIKQLQCP
jgi:tol-pal system protein YbgF